jgi:hypothetical protein
MNDSAPASGGICDLVLGQLDKPELERKAWLIAQEFANAASAFGDTVANDQ